MSKEKEEEKKLWTPLVRVILFISGALLFFSLFSPYVFTQFADDVDYQFDGDTGVIGDTFGIMNPFIGLIGILLTFLAFYMQIKANEEQIKQFNLTRNDDKKMLLQTQKIEAYDNLDLLSINLDSIIKDLKAKGERIGQYGNALKTAPFESHLLKRTPSKDYLKILEINRGAIYKAYKFFSVSDNIDYIKLYNTLDFLPEFFEDFYPRVSNFIKESFSEKMKLRDKILMFLDANARVLVRLELKLGTSATMNKNVELINETIQVNQDILQENYDEDGNPLSETDWAIVDDKLLKPFIISALELKNGGLLDGELISVIEYASNVRKDIALLKNRSTEFADQIILQYEDLFNDKVGELSVETSLFQINEKIKKALEIAKIEIDLFYN